MTAKKWLVRVEHFGTRERKVVPMPGGLSEAEALRGAVLKCGNYWRALSAELIEVAP